MLENYWQLNTRQSEKENKKPTSELPPCCYAHPTKAKAQRGLSLCQYVTVTFQHLSCCVGKCNGSWNLSFASFTTMPELYFYGKIPDKSGRKKRAGPCSRVRLQSGGNMKQGKVWEKSSLQIIIMIKICKAQTPWLKALKKFNTHNVDQDRKCYQHVSKQLTRNEHISISSNIIKVQDAHTHTHTHIVQTDSGEGQCCLTGIFGEKKWCLEFAFEVGESSRVLDTLGE